MTMLLYHKNIIHIYLIGMDVHFLLLILAPSTSRWS